MNLKDFQNFNPADAALESGCVSGNLQQYSNPDTAGTGIRQALYRGGGPNTQTRRLTQQDAALLSSNLKSHDYRKKYESQSPINRNAKEGIVDVSNNSRSHPDQSQEGSAGARIMFHDQSPGLMHESSLRRTPLQTNKQVNMRHNIHKINQFNKLSFVRAASEPSQPLNSGILNSKSVILPVDEEGEFELDPKEEKRPPNNQEHKDHLNQQITENDLKNSQMGKFNIFNNKFMNNSQELKLHNKEQKKRSSSSFIVSNFFNGPLVQSQMGPQSAVSNEQQQTLKGVPG